MRTKLFSLLLAALLSFVFVGSTFAAELTVYSARKEHLIKPLFEAYTAQTGVEIRYITDKAGPLLQRLKAEGKNTKADLLITVDAGNLWHAGNEGILQPVQSEVLTANIPANLRDKDNQWFGLSLRARTIVYNTNKVKPGELSTYAALGEPAWKGRLLLRTSKKVYNQSLVAMMIAEYGETQTEQIVKGWVANLAAAPFSNDTKTMQAIAAGQGDVGIVNTYYFARLKKKDPSVPLALFWPNQTVDGSGVHVNVSGAGVTKHAKHPEAAIKFIEWLSSDKAQNLFADVNQEYPVNPAVKPSDEVASWGTFTASPFDLTKAGELQTDAIKLMDRVGYR
ncbi:MAG: Fe(3+) ABC transporter substrate-binding protein [Desulfuromonas sp.]|mgnify:CR=1 FL=1|nr:MAG: Fe(3+) ABC transporter substrate-binding protein [Desulfuromonas sp.]